VNSPDDYGVVMGNWSEDFGSGTPPSRWLGSQRILQQYYETKKPVKYGQCWVFAGVLATVCRAIGLPCRVITNYSSAHDTQNSLTVDYFVDDNGQVMEELNSDSIWYDGLPRLVFLHALLSLPSKVRATRSSLPISF
jgi:transglutaminase 1